MNSRRYAYGDFRAGLKTLYTANGAKLLHWDSQEYREDIRLTSHAAASPCFLRATLEMGLRSSCKPEVVRQELTALAYRSSVWHGIPDGVPSRQVLTDLLLRIFGSYRPARVIRAISDE